MRYYDDKLGRWVSTSGPRLGSDGKWTNGPPGPQAIETEYGGVRFRSRLEARWALFFDELGVGWEYEPEGFRLSDGRCYLPDFRITGCDWFLGPGTFKESPRWAEVKPPGDDFELAKSFARELKTFVVLCEGPPGATLGLAMQHPTRHQTGVIFSERQFRAAGKARTHRFWEPKK